ncbi:MAG: S8 family serine peptidase [Verrucomicrobia bacterium]|nr:S8 family serine peptidase [Verrucomicrobiota bacterium]
MKRYCLNTGWLMLAFWVWLGATGLAQPATNALVWRAAQERVDADLRDWPLERVLKEIAARSGWQIFIEPGIQPTISAKFKDLPLGEALPRLLDQLNFALLPQTNRPPHLYVFRTSLQEATQPVRVTPGDATAAGHDKLIPNELIVSLKPGADIDALARALGAEVVGRIAGLNAYRLRFKDEAQTDLARRTLAETPEVQAVDNNYFIDRPPGTRQVLSTSLGPPQIRPRAPGDGGVVVGLIDTAVQRLEGGLDAFLLPGVSVAGEPAAGGDLTHGKAMAETLLRGLQTVAGNQSGVRILPVDVYGANPTTTTFEVGRGVYEAVNQHGATLLNLSLGTEANSPFLFNLLQSASEQGVLIIAAAGNTPGTTLTLPAAWPWVIAVTAGNRAGQIDPWANRADFVDLVGPGTSIVHHDGQAYYVTGTSSATATATGLAAGLAETKNKAPAEIEAELRKLLPAPAKTAP